MEGWNKSVQTVVHLVQVWVEKASGKHRSIYHSPYRSIAWNRDHDTGLPENAYKELKPGEEYRPVMDRSTSHPEVTPWSVIWGLVMAVLFSAAAAYSGLKIGQVFEAAIPIAILAVGLSTAFGRKNALGQNVIIQSIGASSGVIVAGAIFTIPALYILDLPASFYQVFLASRSAASSASCF